jgi:hypothetical protein
MTQDMIKKFDKEFPNSRGIFENNDPYNSRRNAIKNFILSAVSQAKEEGRKQGVEEERNQ